MSSMPVQASGRNAIHTRAASHPRVELLDRTQYATGEGPCLSAAAADAPVVVSGELGSDERWPRFGRAAVDLGIRSAISFKLFDGRESIGALTLYAETPSAFPPSAEQCGALLAAHAAVVMAASRKQADVADQLRTAGVLPGFE